MDPVGEENGKDSADCKGCDHTVIVCRVSLEIQTISTTSPIHAHKVSTELRTDSHNNLIVWLAQMGSTAQKRALFRQQDFVMLALSVHRTLGLEPTTLSQKSAQLEVTARKDLSKL